MNPELAKNRQRVSDIIPEGFIKGIVVVTAEYYHYLYIKVYRTEGSIGGIIHRSEHPVNIDQSSVFLCNDS